jgi:hypothetical protein
MLKLFYFKNKNNESHFILAILQKKFHCNFSFYQTINLVAHLKVEFQHAMMCQIEVEKTWFTTKASHTLMIFILVQEISFAMTLRRSLSKLTSLGSVKPICKSKYRTFLPFTTHTSCSFYPQM